MISGGAKNGFPDIVRDLVILLSPVALEIAPRAASPADEPSRDEFTPLAEFMTLLNLLLK